MSRKESLEQFVKQPEIKLWINGARTEIKDSTKDQYVQYLMRFLADESPGSFLKRAQENPREVAVEVKGRLGEIYKHSMSGAHITKCALLSFLVFHEVEMQVNGKIRVRRIRKKPELTWENAEKIISFCDEPYRTIFKFMVASGLGEDELMEIQNSTEIQSSIEAQRNNDKTYLRIDLTPRKSNLDTFFSLTPKKHVPTFPLKNRGGSIISGHDCQMNWRRAARKAKLWHEGLGPHSLRSVFKTECAKSGVAYGVSEFCLGHGGGDRYGYSREVLNEGYLATELGKLWDHTEPATVDALRERDETIRILQAEVKKLRDEFEAGKRLVYGKT